MSVLSEHLYRWREITARLWAWAWICSTHASADRLQAILGDAVKPTDADTGQPYIALALPESVEHAELSPLIGRTCLLMPDATPEAAARMLRFSERLRAIAGRVRLVDTGEDPFGWSPEWQGSASELQAYAHDRITEFPAPQGRAPAAHPPSEGATSSSPAAAGNPDDPPEYEFPPEAAIEPPEEVGPAPVELSEDAFANHFADLHGANWRCVKAWGRWFFWDGEAWAEDRTDSRVEPMRQLFREAQHWPQARDLTPASKRAIFGRQVPIYAALRLAGTDRRLRAEPDIWDADPWMLGVPGGVIDLTCGKLIESAREQHVTMRCSIAPQAGKPELWLRLLDQWLGAADVIGFLRRYLGYGLTGDAREQCMAFFYGKAQSGKGTILRAISGILGSSAEGSNRFRSYHYEAPISTFLESRSDRHSTELAAFYKKRLITSEEPSAGARWDEGKLKWITGGSQITARFIAQDNFSFAMSAKIIVAANHRPRLASTDKAIRRRMHVIPFEHPVADENRDNALDAKIREEWPQILNWLIEGCLEWQDAGLGLPETIAEATDQYIEAEDTLGAWLAECCEQDETRATESASLHQSYSSWCERNGEKPWSRRAWANALVDRGFKAGKGTHGTRIIRGLELKLGANLP